MRPLMALDNNKNGPYTWFKAGSYFEVGLYEVLMPTVKHNGGLNMTFFGFCAQKPVFIDVSELCTRWCEPTD